MLHEVGLSCTWPAATAVTTSVAIVSTITATSATALAAGFAAARDAHARMITIACRMKLESCDLETWLSDAPTRYSAKRACHHRVRRTLEYM